MKIFSLEKRSHLIVWSIGLAFVVTLALYLMSLPHSAGSCGAYLNCLNTFNKVDLGWPVHFYIDGIGNSKIDPSGPAFGLSFFANFLCYMVVWYLVLSILSYIKNQNEKVIG